MARLALQITPIRPSPLHSHHTPRSPASPIKPQIERRYHSPKLRQAPLVSSHPPIPSPWLWSCHKCHSSYPIGATRRCLHDGHRFCSGFSIVGGRRKEHAPCGSVFDYQSWRTFASWRRESLASTNSKISGQEGPYGCFERCDFPSQCRWAPRFVAEEQQRAHKQESVESIVEAETERSPSDRNGLIEAAATANTSRATSFSLLAASSNPAMQSIARMLKSAERRSSHIVNLFHPSEVESALEVRVFESDSLMDNEDEFSFSSFKDRMDKHHGAAFGNEKSFFEDDEDDNDDDDSDNHEDGYEYTQDCIDHQHLESRAEYHATEVDTADQDAIELMRPARSDFDDSHSRAPFELLLQAAESDDMDLTTSE